MRFSGLSLPSAAALAIMIPLPSFADAPPAPNEPTTTWECPQADGTPLYTNKEKAGCRAMTLKPLSIVPDLEHMPTIPQTVSAVPPYHPPAYPGSSLERQQVPDWARDWRASIAPSGSVQEEVCTLYSEWVHLVQKTRGGFFFGSDPSYGGDVTGRNQRGPSYSFYDNARYIALSRLFGTGFVPVGCP
jgi:hypothetical protein